MTSFLIIALKFYKKFISPVGEIIFGKACRYTPTCSEYAILSLEKFGTIKGLGLAFNRLLRCHPWGGSGHDPVPVK